MPLEFYQLFGGDVKKQDIVENCKDIGRFRGCSLWTASRPGKLLEKVEAVEQVLTHGHGHRQLGRGHKKTGKLWNKGAPCPIGKKDTGGEAT